MAEVAPEPVAAAAPTKTTKKKPATRTKRAGPSVGELIVKTVSASKERNGVSLAALKKALAAGGYDVEKNSHRVRNAVKHLVAKETLVQTKGVGASGSFKVNKKQQEAAKKKPAKKAAPKAKKPVAKKASPAKKPKKVAAKKPAAKKSPKKAKKPAAAAKKVVAKKAKKPVTAKKSAKSPKKAKPVKPKVAKPKATKPKKAAKKK